MILDVPLIRRESPKGKLDAENPPPSYWVRKDTEQEIALERVLVERDLLWCEAAQAKLEVADRRKALASLHPLLMARIYFPDWVTDETPAFHFEIVNGYMHHARYAVAAPVGSAKTTVMTKIGTIWSVFFERAHERSVDDILIISGSGELAGMFLDDMGIKLLASEELREDFGEFKGSHWGSTTLEFVFHDSAGKRTRTAFIRTIGRGGTIRGRRPDRIVVDDPEDEESVKSEKQRGDFREWFWGAVVNRLDTHWKKLTYIGTCISEETFIVELIKAPPPGWHSRSLAMLDESVTPPTSLWEARWPVTYLQQRRAEIGDARFRSEFQNDPVRMWHQRIFDTTRIRWDPWVVKPDDFVSLCVDPSFVPGGDPWAITMIAVDRHGDWHEIVSPQKNNGLQGWLEELLVIRTTYSHINVVGVEGGSGGQSSIDYILNKWTLEHGVSLPFRVLKNSHTKGPKERRISKLKGLINQEKLKL